MVLHLFLHMPKPTNKTELLTQSQGNYQRILDILATYSDESLLYNTFNDTKLFRNVRDVLAHLHHWHLMFLGWYEKGMNGEKPAMPAEGYTWRTLPDLNKAIWEQYLETDLATVRALFEDSHQQVQACIESHSDEELFTKKLYGWTGSTSLGAYLISNTASHYAWAYKKIKKTLPH